jgi:hypothetical protein
MNQMRLRRALGTTAAMTLLLGAAACGGSSGESKAESEGSSTGVSCDGLLKDANASAALPADLPKPDDAVFYEVQTQGQTKRYFAHVPGSDFVKERDELKAQFESKGLKILGTDQEEVEAEFEFETAAGVEGSVQVVPLCKDNLRVRWRVGPK